MWSPGLEFEAGRRQAAVDQVGRYWIFFSLRLTMRTRPDPFALQAPGWRPLYNYKSAGGANREVCRAGEARRGSPAKNGYRAARQEHGQEDRRAAMGTVRRLARQPVTSLSASRPAPT